MGLTDISRVTTAITTLVDEVLNARDALPDTLTLTAAPPDDTTVQGESVISVYLFHVEEDPHQRNTAPYPPAFGEHAIQQHRMGLVLNYVITARNTTGEDAGAKTIAEQRLLGYVARALHDFPVIDDDTRVTPTSMRILETAQLAGHDNRIDLILRPVGTRELVDFWSAEQSLTPRLSLFYEARVLLLDPPPPPEVPGVVLSIGTYLFPGGAPRIERTRSVVSMRPPPGFALLEPAQPYLRVPVEPARAAIFDPAGVDPLNAAHPDNNHLVIEGASLRGDRTLLWLYGPREVAGQLETGEVRVDLSDPTINPDWGFVVRDAEVEARVQRQVTDERGQLVTLYPGLYRARLVVERQPPGDASGRRTEHSTNEAHFALTPQTVRVDTVGANPIKTITVELFSDYLRTELDVRVAVGGEVMTRAPAPLTNPGTYAFASGTAVLTILLDTTGLVSPLPVQVTIEGADSTPAWAVFP